jgi:superfamily II DNA/RNA helicase
VRVEIAADESTPDLTTHHFLDTKRDKRVEVAASLVSEHGSTVVFCRTKHGTDRVTKQLRAAGVKAVPIHGGRSQAQRDRALATFAAGKAQALVATDVAARGIHVDDVRCVLHFDIATSNKDYLHRSGRTGRAGAAGVVISLVTEGDGAAARQLQKGLSMPLSAKSSGSRAGGNTQRDGAAPSRDSGPARSGGAEGAGGAAGRRSSRYPDRSQRADRPQRSYSAGGTGGTRSGGDRRFGSSSGSGGQAGGQSSRQGGRRTGGRGRAA